MEGPSSSAPADPLLGAVLDQRYRIERKLGQGGMGMVYLGEHVRTGRKCAVKLLPPEAAQDPEAVKRFEREARVLGALGHPGIVGIHDFSETPDGRPYFVMDYLEGEDLQTRLQRVGRLSWDDTRKIVDEIAAALYAAHQAGVLHRDLKPANVFLAKSRGAPERVVLLDFGLAKGGVKESVVITRSDMVMGTPLYMSPEQARSAGVDARSDIYSLAALTFELLAGRPPFVGQNYTAVLASLLTDPPPKLSESASGQVPGHLDVALEVALSKAPESRQPDVASFATAVLQQKPRWVDATAQRAAVRGTALAATMASSPEVQPPVDVASAATVASSPEVSPQADLASAATMASDAVQRPADPAPPASVAPSIRPAPPPVSVSGSDLAVQQASGPLSPSSVEAASPGPRRVTLLPVVVVLVIMGLVGAVVAYWLGQKRGGGAKAKGDRPQATAPNTTADAAVEAPPRTPDASVATPDAAPASQDAMEPPPRVRRRVASPRPRPRPRVRAMPAPRPRPRAMDRPMRRRAAMRRPRTVRLGDLMIQGRYRECVKRARRMGRNVRALKDGYLCANRIRNRRAMKYFCRQYLALRRSDNFTVQCQFALGLRRPM